ncbi:MAG: alpha/beta hydrolase [Clostridia bacterium]|nr:alpha/beta hydrolase [Clostridia bacterium]
MFTVPVIIVFALLLIAVAFAVGLARYTFCQVFKTKREKHYDLDKRNMDEKDEFIRVMHSLTDELAALPYESVYTESYDGLRLHARYYHVKDGAPLNIQFHGYRSSPLRDFCGIGAECMRQGHNLLLVDQRAHGKSEGKVISFGIKERFDCVSWANYAVERFGKDVKIILGGLSMGAATVLMAAELDLPENVIGIIADCPYSSVKEIIKKVCSDRGLPADRAYPFIKLGGILFGGFNSDAASPREAVKNTDIPIFIAHGVDDGFVPISMSDEIIEGARDAFYRRVPGADHAEAFGRDHVGYSNDLSSFFEKITKGEK